MSDNGLTFDLVNDLLIISKTTDYLKQFKSMGYDDTLVADMSEEDLNSIFGNAIGHKKRFWRELCQHRKEMNIYDQSGNVSPIIVVMSETDPELDMTSVPETNYAVAEADQTLSDVTSLGHSSQSSSASDLKNDQSQTISKPILIPAIERYLVSDVAYYGQLNAYPYNPYFVAKEFKEVLGNFS